jgi:hypothetical protein
MIESKYIMGFMTSAPEFWYWGVNKIQNEDNGVSFYSQKLSNKVRIQVSVDRKGFKVVCRKAGLLNSKIIKKYTSINPIDLHEVINHLIFQPQQKVA